MGRVEGKVALVTGAARGQGRSHAVRLAEEGADIIAVDACADIATAPYAMATADDLAETARQVEALDRRVVAHQADVRDLAALQAAVAAGVDGLGKLDVVVANAGIVSYDTAETMSEEKWRELIDINLTGVYLTLKAALPRLEDGSSLVLISSTAGLFGMANIVHYTAAKHGVVGVMRVLAHELAPRMIRVNTVHPTSVNTDMIHNEGTYRLFRPDLEHPTADDILEPAAGMNLLPIAAVEPIDVSNAVLFLASDEARYITGSTLSVDAGAVARSA
jgi:SDR family mycofactocin-dependent oxidoreductase